MNDEPHQDTTPPIDTPFTRAMEDFKHRRDEFAREQEEVLKGEDHRAEFRLMMWAAGRTDNPFRT